MQKELKKPIRIHVVTKQKRKGEPSQTIQVRAKGMLYQKDNSTYLTYDEKDEDGHGTTRTTLKIEPLLQKVTVLRHGVTQMKYIWERGKTSSTVYATAFGAFDMEIHTNTIQIQIDELFRSGLIQAKYRLLFGGERSDIEFRLTFEEAVLG